ncbi:MAG: DUF362 domain-containing protein [Proteobacteria bacterium]|nr:DUF362 domain-containing protein [Pseudomonadota bacterium]
MTQNDIVIMYGDRPADMVDAILNHLSIEDELPQNGTIGIKPNLVLSKPSESGATTDPEIVSAVIEYLHSRGLRDIIILESSWVGDTTDRAYRVCGYEPLNTRYGVPLIDLKTDTTQKVRAGDFTVDVCERALGLKYLINIPVLKAHCQTRMTCALKNLKGCIPDWEKQRFHATGLSRPIACLNTILKTDLVIVDGIIGDLTYEEGGNPVHMNRIIAGRDPVLIDAYAATLMGYSPNEIEYIPLAEEMGVGATDLATAGIIELNQPDILAADISATGIALTLAGYISEDQACSACFGSLIHALQRLSDRGSIKSLEEKISIGQGFKDKTGHGIGVGACTEGLSHTIDGCPPNAQKIVDFLMRIIAT